MFAKLLCFIFGHVRDERYKSLSWVQPFTFDTYKTRVCKRCLVMYLKKEEVEYGD